jgi:ubiquinol-cytochrome c reductase cytochrome c subunit
MRRAVVAASFLLAVVPAARATDGAGLFADNCARCHGVDGRGVANQGPSLRHVGARAADFYLRTGYMPLRDPRAEPYRQRPLFTDAEIRAIVAYVASLGAGPPIPSPQWRTGSVASGMRLFTDHCAGCHQVVAQGGYVTGARVPPLGNATPRQIAEAVRTGPYLMPRFSPKAISPTQLNDLIAYVQYAKHPQDPGGWGIGHLGPWPEGMVAWLLAGTVLVAMCMVFGKRLKA